MCNACHHLKMRPDAAAQRSGDATVVRGDGSLHDEVRALVGELTALGPRPSGSAASVAAADVLTRALLARDAGPYRGRSMALPYGGGSVNLAAVVRGTERHRRPLVLASHYDGPPASPGAGDNAAAVALLVVLTPLLAQRRFERDVIVVLLDGGDPDHAPARALGAEHFVRHQRRHDLKAAIVVDRIGHHPGPSVPPLLLVGAECDPRLPPALDGLHATAPEVAPVRHRHLERAPAVDAFREQGIPALWLTGGRAPHHRGGDDRIEHLDEGMLAGTAVKLLALTDHVAATRLPGPCGDHDVQAFEQRAWKRWAGRGRLSAGKLDRLVREALPRLAP